MTRIFLLLSITLTVPPLLDPTKILPESLSAICLGVTIFSAKISIEKPFSIFRFLMSFMESEKTLEDSDLEKINKLIISTVETKSGAKIRS